MTAATIPGEGEIVTLMKVQKVDGTVRYLMQSGDKTVEITEEEYKARGGA